MPSRPNMPPLPPTPIEPPSDWQHRILWENVKDALHALPAHFLSGTNIEGINATDIFTLNSALGATIENQVVDTLNQMRNIWDPSAQYETYLFVRQPQSFPDVVLKNLSAPDESPIMGIELKGWYLLAKEGEPSLRFTQTANACANADLIMVVPWVLNNVISGRPRVYTPYIVSAKYAANYRNYYWKHLRQSRGDNSIRIPTNAAPYPKKSDETADDPVSDKGGNFGRIARCGIMDDYKRRISASPLCGIQATYWLDFFKIFHQDVTDQEIREQLDQLRGRASAIAKPAQQAAFSSVINALEQFIEQC